MGDSSNNCDELATNLFKNNKDPLKKLSKKEKDSYRWIPNNIQGNFFEEFIAMSPGKEMSSWEMVYFI